MQAAFTPYGSDADRFLALSQGKIDASVEGTMALGQFLKTPQGKDFVICCPTSFPYWQDLRYIVLTSERSFQRGSALCLAS
jgi:hypothetical protein